MKRRRFNLFAIILAVSMVFTMAPLSMDHAYAADPVTTTIDGVVYTLNEEAGTAAVTDNTAELPAVATIPQSVSFENKDFTVTSIGDFAFLNCEKLKAITIPKDVTSIGNSAFWNSGLTSVTFAEGSMLATIDDSAFSGCKSLETITLPKSVTSIGTWVFNGCEALQSINIPESMTSIKERTFGGCFSLTAVTFTAGSKLISIEKEAFVGCKSLETITLPKDVTSIGPSAFSMCLALQSINIPEGVESIGKDAFYSCRQLSTVTIPASVESIGENAFHWSGLASVTFAEGSKLMTIAKDMFSDCFSLKIVTIPASVKSIESNAFANAPLTTINFGGSKSQWDAITGEGKPTNVTVNFAKEDPVKPISIKGAKVVLSATAFTYNGKVMKPSVKTIGGKTVKAGTDYTAKWSNAASKNIGTYTVTVTGKGKYKDTAKATYQIVPKGTTLKKPKKAKKAATVKWKAQKAKMPKARVTGYRIQLATDRAFKMNVKTVNVKGYKKASKKVNKLKAKTKYYVRICTYMKTGGKTYYSPWSKVKTVKTK